MDSKVKGLINDQIAHEFYAAYLYLAMAAHFEDQNYEGFAQWMRLQAKEEVGHAMRLFDFLVERGERVELKKIDQPKADFGTPKEAFAAALAHEKKVTGQINELYGAAVEAKDYATQTMLQWFIDEQVEEEDTTSRAVDQLDMAEGNKAALLMLDAKFGDRSAVVEE